MSTNCYIDSIQDTNQLRQWRAIIQVMDYLQHTPHYFNGKKKKFQAYLHSSPQVDELADVIVSVDTQPMKFFRVCVDAIGCQSVICSIRDAVPGEESGEVLNVNKIPQSERKYNEHRLRHATTATMYRPNSCQEPSGEEGADEGSEQSSS